MWIFLGNVLTMAYKATLLSSLIPIRYETTIDNVIDLDNSGLPLVYAKASSFHKHIADDPRPIMRRISNRSIQYNVDGGIPEWAFKM